MNAFIVIDSSGASHSVLCDRFIVDNGALFCLTGLGEATTIAAIFAANGWIRCAKAPN